MPKDKVTGKHQGYGFVEFRGEEDAEYAIKVMNMVTLKGLLNNTGEKCILKRLRKFRMKFCLEA
jgi:RNA recognition motif-containing protein